MRVVLTCVSPLSHGAFGESAGNTTLCRRMTVVSLPDRPRIPCVSGNALRGVLRRIVMREMLDRAQMDRAAMGARWDRLYAVLANGGHLEGTADDVIRPDEIRALRASLPPLSIFGAAMYSRMLAGRMTVGFLWPRSIETLAAGLVSEAPQIHAEDLVVELTHTRHVDREEQSPSVSGVTPMPQTMEILAPGAILESEIYFGPGATAIEKSCIARGLDRLSAIGGRAAAGLGRVTVAHDGDAQPYSAWLEETTDLRDRLEALSHTLVPRPPPKVARKAAEATPAP